jgi:DNA-binding GntR family transcriptional regulator
MSSNPSTRPARPVRPSRSVLSDETFGVIRAMLLDHTIAPGQHINIDALSRELEVSPTPVREALARLESDDLVVKQPLRGYTATELLTVFQLDDLFQFRLLIEPWSAEKAAERANFEERAELHSELERGAKVGSLGMVETYAAMSEHDARFHELIARLSGSEFVRDAFARTHCHLHLFRLYQAGHTQLSASGEDTALINDLFNVYYTPNTGILASREHEAIGTAILTGDTVSSRSLMHAHIQSSRERFGPAMKAVTGG